MTWAYRDCGTLLACGIQVGAQAKDRYCLRGRHRRGTSYTQHCWADALASASLSQLNGQALIQGDAGNPPGVSARLRLTAQQAASGSARRTKRFRGQP